MNQWMTTAQRQAEADAAMAQMDAYLVGFDARRAAETNAETIEEVASLDGVEIPAGVTVVKHLNNGPRKGHTMTIADFWAQIARREAREYTSTYRIVRKRGRVIRVGVGLKGASLHNVWYDFS